MGVFMWLGRERGSATFIVLGVLCSLMILAAVFYAAYRERACGDKSETVSPRATVATLAVVALWVGYIVYRTVHR